MARKKKSEPVPEPVEDTNDVPEETQDATCFIPFENGMPDGPTSVLTIRSDEISSPEITTVFNESHTSIQAHDEDYIKKIAHAFEVIEKCNLYMWAGLDWGAGRIYEMSRKEWSNYVIAMYEWSDGGFTGPEPEMPSEVKYE